MSSLDFSGVLVKIFWFLQKLRALDFSATQLLKQPGPHSALLVH
jgi:hypothetical protein